jgi:hypothetical protein
VAIAPIGMPGEAPPSGGGYAFNVVVQGKGPKVGMRLSRVGIVLAVLALSLTAASAASAASVRSEFFGIVQTATLDDQDVQGMQAAKVRTTRFVLNWGAVEPGKGRFKWDTVDRFVGTLASHGIRVVPSIWGNPNWLPGSSSTPPIGGPQAEQQWRNFLKALVVRYRAGGTYWTTYYPKRFGANATPLPIQTWQIWNEPNLKKYFAPYPSPGKYARLLQISYPAIKSMDHSARVITAGMPGYGDVHAWTFLGNLYSVAGIKGYFDAVALHPYGPNLNRVKSEIQRVRNVMTKRGDGATPLWIDEIAWGSAHPDSHGINKGLNGQARMLRRAFKLILTHRAGWNIEHVFWYHWRDPRRSQAMCSFCGSAGLLRFNHDAKPAMKAFKSFTADAIAPKTNITSGPPDGGFSRDATPTFRFASNQIGSTFRCHFDARAFGQCPSPYTPFVGLSQGPHVFYVRAVDPPGNVSATVSRTFTVDTVPPPTPRITATNPASPANDNNPRVKGNAAAGTSVRIYTTAGCAGTPVAQASPAVFGAQGIAVSVLDNTTTSFRATATDAAGNASGCSPPITYVEDSTP